MSVNKVMLIGRLGGDPDIRTFDDGGKIATVSIATSERWTDKQTGEKRETTEWHRVVFSNRLAEIAEQYLTKGSKVYVEGSIKTKKWTDQQGADRTSTEIRASLMQMLGSKNDGGGYSQTGYPQPPQTGYPQNGYSEQQPKPSYPQSGERQQGFKDMATAGKALPTGNVNDDEMPF